MEIQEWMNLDILGGYNSLFGDGERWQIDLCQTCMYELFGRYIRILPNPIAIE